MVPEEGRRGPRIGGLKAATLGIRPERLQVLWDNATASHKVTGKVVERYYFGADDIPVGAPIRLAYDPEALVAAD